MTMKKYVYKGGAQSGGLKKKLRIPLFASFFIMILGFAGIATSIQNEHLEANVLEEISEVKAALKNHIAIDTAAITGFIDLIKKNEDLKNALISEDRTFYWNF